MLSFFRLNSDGSIQNKNRVINREPAHNIRPNCFDQLHLKDHDTNTDDGLLLTGAVKCLKGHDINTVEG
jgi:hypothetical protein